MSEYNHTVAFIIPNAHVETAKRISRSLDPDIGGYEAFQTFASSDRSEPATHAIYGAPVRESFLQLLPALMASPEALKATVDADYANRWPGEVPPSLAECEAFLVSLQIYIDLSWDEVLAQSGLQIIAAGI